MKTTAYDLEFLQSTNVSKGLPLGSEFAIKMAAVFAVWLARSKSRNALKNLEDFRLEDVGITRAQSEAESIKRFWMP